jgi:hypothetical protein
VVEGGKTLADRRRERTLFAAHFEYGPDRAELHKVRPATF